MSFYRVLLVDDDTFFLKVYGGFLRSHGFEVDAVANGEEALARYQTGKYQLLVIDLIMPGLSGIELIERIRQLHPAQDVVVVTASGDARTAVRAMRLGVYDYLVKPIEREELLLVIDRLQERSTLYDEHARLLDENLHHAAIQQIYQRGLRVMQTLNLETVCESLLETLSDTCGAQGAALWLGREDGGELAMHGYRGLLELAALPISWDPAQAAIGAELAVGLPVLVGRDIAAVERQGEAGEAMLVPLARDGRLNGVVALFDKLGGSFTMDDTARARIIAECAVTAVLHARRFRHLERVGLRDPATTAYNMTYFVDYLGRELHKARRYRRSFSLVQISIDGAATLKQSLTPELYRETLRQLALAISSVLRDIDVLARVSDAELYLLSPETDFLGGLAFARAARDAIQKSPFLADIDGRHPLCLSFGPAAFPRDGDDVDQLFAACRRRLDEARRSLFRRLHLEDVDFWGAVELLVGDESRYGPEAVDEARALTVTEDDKGLSRHHVFPAGFGDVARAEVLSEAAQQAKSSGWLFFGAPSAQADGEMLRRLRALEASALRTYFLSAVEPRLEGELGHVTLVHGGDPWRHHELVLLLAEHSAYGMLARRRQDGRLFGFHTADWTLVEGLIGKLQDAYHLQKGAA